MDFITFGVLLSVKFCRDIPERNDEIYVANNILK